MMRRVIAMAVLLSGCAATVPAPSSPITVPVPVPCITKAPERPNVVSDAELEAMSDYQLVYALWRDRLQRIGYEGELEVIISTCGATR